MSAQITNQYPGTIGRMFARQSVPAVYGAQKAAAEMDAEETKEIRDSVSLSAMAPKPLTTGFLEQALSTGKSLGEGSALSTDTTNRLREDRIFAAVSALALVGHSQENPVSGWPGGIPTPTREELEAARRRLAQRPNDSGDADNTESVLNQRIDLLRQIGKSDFSSLAFAAADR